MVRRRAEYLPVKRFLAILILLLSAGAVRADITSNLVAHWKLDETSGTSAADSAGSYTGTYVNSPTLNQTGAFGSSKAVTFASASSQKVTATNPITTYPFSLAVWVKPTDTSSQTEIMELKTTLGHVRIEQRIDGSLRILRYDGTVNDFTLSKSGVFAAGTWSHVTLTCNSASETTAYVNGGSPVSVSVSVAYTSQTGVTLAGSVAGFYFNGTLDDVRIYSRALSAADVAELYAYTGAAKFPYWYFHNSGLRRNPFDAFATRQPLAILKAR